MGSILAGAVMTFFEAPHIDNIDLDDKMFSGQSWRERWPNFKPYELCSPDTKSLKVYLPALDALQAVRIAFGKPMNITSAYRTVAHNARVGGVKGSQHVKGRAFDIALARKSDGPLLERLAAEKGFVGIGRYGARRFIHIDMRTGNNARWGRW